MQKRLNSNALAMELRPFFTNPSIGYEVDKNVDQSTAHLSAFVRFMS